ncbi:hypothetical protein BDZ89DRAFT_1173714 [Hymenopellis radicata]|nr:hypothetical protein BDZ89DRAFT_1173714 [Hymenopellis radicata]
MNFSSTQRGHNGGAAGYPTRVRGASLLTQASSNYHIEPQLVMAPRLTSNLLSYPQVEPQYEPQRTAYPPRLHHGLQGQGYNMHATPMLHEQRPSTLLSSYQQGPYDRHDNDTRAMYPRMTSGMRTYMAQQAPADAASVRAPETWVDIENGGVDLRRSLPSMRHVVSSRDIVVQFPDGITEIVRAQDHMLTLRMVAKVVQQWYERNTNRSGSKLQGFRVCNGVYVAQIV